MDTIGTASSAGVGTLILLGVCLVIALGFEFVNGFHDTANAVATVIYTRSLKPGVAVAWSGFLNFLGVFFGVSSGAAVAYSIVHLLPVDLLIHIGSTAGLLMVLSLLLSAIIWNLGTWYFGLPASSSHALIGSILGVGLASSFFSPSGVGSGVNWDKAIDVGKALLLSPLVGFLLAGLLLLISKAVLKNPVLYREPDGENPPPLWIRILLTLTCSGVSFAHGSNDGQKGVGLVMLILIGLLPAQFALNNSFTPTQTQSAIVAVQKAEASLATHPDDATVAAKLHKVSETMSGATDIKALPTEERNTLRSQILEADSALGKMEKAGYPGLSTEEATALKDARKAVRPLVDFVVPWVVVAVAIALGAGTTVGWKRIVVTVGEKIGKTHLNYAQGAAAEMVAMGTIAAADHFGLPVSTTHVLSSGIAGTMAANRSGLQMATIRNIALAWVLTLPATMLLSGLLFSLTASRYLKQVAPVAPQVQQQAKPRVQPGVN